MLEVGAVVFWKRKGNVVLCKPWIKHSKTEFAFYRCIKHAMFLRFPTLSDTKKLELDLLCSGADGWHTKPGHQLQLQPQHLNGMQEGLVRTCCLEALAAAGLDGGGALTIYNPFN